MSQYTYSLLPTGQGNIRLLRLLPHTDAAAPIECKLFDYSLNDRRRTSHLYEALSYVWGDASTTLPISIDGAYLEVTTNLHVALRRLRDPVLERIIWIDAVCINQNDLKERAEQVRFMVNVYRSASRVVVWLGEESKDSERAIDAIFSAANDSTMPKHKQYRDYEDKRLGEYEGSEKEPHHDTGAVLGLLRRPWFRRIWVLQEIAAARSVSILCGPEEISSQCFCRGIRSLGLDYGDDRDLQEWTASTIYLMDEHSPRLGSQADGALQLNMRPLPQLIDMFRGHKASDRRDKVFALLGMSDVNAGAAGLLPDYEIHWHVLFQRLIKHSLVILGPRVDAKIRTWNDREVAVIQCRGCLMGRVTTVENDYIGRQLVEFRMNVNHSCNNTYCTPWPLHSFAQRIRVGDMLCLLQGAENLMIVRPNRDHFSVIVAVAFPLSSLVVRLKLDWCDPSKLDRDSESFRRHLLLIWNWENLPVLNTSQEYKGFPFDSEQDGGLDGFRRLSNMARHFDDAQEQTMLERTVVEMQKFAQSIGETPPYFVTHIETLTTVLARWDAYLLLRKRVVAYKEIPTSDITEGSPCFDLGSEQELENRQTDKNPLGPPHRTYKYLELDVLEMVELMKDDPQLVEEVVRMLPHIHNSDSLPVLEVLFLLFELLGVQAPCSAITRRVLPFGHLGDLYGRTNHHREHYEIWQTVEYASKHQMWGGTLLSNLFDNAKHDVTLAYQVLFAVANLMEDGSLEGRKMASTFFDEQADAILPFITGTNLCRCAGMKTNFTCLVDILHRRSQLSSDLLAWQKLHVLFFVERDDDWKVARELFYGSLYSYLPMYGLGKYLLRCAVVRNYPRVAEALIETGQVDVNDRSTGECETLRAAIALGNIECCRLLLDNHATHPLALRHARRYQGSSPRHKEILEIMEAREDSSP